MIRRPRRSVTRFFIPLLDVFILLFCIFLLMPYVKPAEGEAGAATPLEPKPGDLAELKSEIDALRRERDRLKASGAKCSIAWSFMCSKLIAPTASFSTTIHSASRLRPPPPPTIHRTAAASGSRPRGLFLFLFPRRSSGYPLERQMSAYSEWFKDVPHGFDDPRGQR